MKKVRLPRIVKPFEHREKIILRDYLALVRTTLANERTLFSYIRTSLYLVLGGVGLLSLDEFEGMRWVGHLTLGLSAILIVFGLIRFMLLKKKLKKFYIEANPNAESPID